MQLKSAFITALMGRENSLYDDPKRLFGPFPIIPGHKLKAATNDWVFSPFLYLWEEQPFEDVGAWRRTMKFVLPYFMYQSINTTI